MAVEARAAPAAPPDVTYEDFLAQMEDLGLLDQLEDALPDGFSAVFEIGRVLADPDSDLGRRLAPATSLAPAQDTGDQHATSEIDALRVETTAGEEYEAEFIRSWSDVRYAYSWQHLLPEEVFLRRWASRTLWFPMAKVPRIRAIDTGADEFSPTAAKQKVHVLLDTSRSMALSHRFALAKACVLRFLKVNRAELGEIHLRTFDVDVGPLQTATTRAEFDALIRRVARTNTLGNGTCLERAIVTATEDVRRIPGLAGAQILVVTDGAARVSEPAVREALGDDVRLHVLKIGHAQVFATDQYVEDTLAYHRDDTTRRGQRMRQLRERRQKIEGSLRRELAPDVRSVLERELSRIRAEERVIADELRADYGHEIERLARVYIEIDDLDARAVFGLTDAQLEGLRELVRELLQRLDEAPVPAEVLKQAALLMSHLQMLAGDQDDSVASEYLEQLRVALEQHMEDALTAHGEHAHGGPLLRPADQRDLRILLHRGSSRGSSLWLALLRYFYDTFAKVITPGRRR